jgi:hypothetical protein
MITAKEAVKISDENVNTTYDKLMEAIYEGIKQNAKIGYYRVCINFEDFIIDQKMQTKIEKELTYIGYKVSFNFYINSGKGIESKEIIITW